MIDGLIRFRRKQGRWPTPADLRSTRGTGYPPDTAVRRIFGDLHSTHRACGYHGPPRLTRFDADDAIQALRRFHEHSGRNPTVRNWTELAQRPSAPTIIRHFGSWNAALAAAAIPAGGDIACSDRIFAAIRAFEARHRRPPSTAHFGGGALPAFETVRLASARSRPSSTELEALNPAEPAPCHTRRPPVGGRSRS